MRKVRIQWPSGWETYTIGVSDGSSFARLLSAPSVNSRINLDKTFVNSSCEYMFDDTPEYGQTQGYFTLKMLSTDQYIKGALIEDYEDTQLLFTGKIAEIPEAGDNEFRIVADFLTFGLDNEVGRTIKNADFPNAPTNNYGAFQNMIFGKASDDGHGDTGILIAKRIDANKYICAEHYIKTLGDCYLPPAGTNINAFCSLTNDVDHHRSIINYSGADVDEIYFNCEEGCRFSIGCFNAANSSYAIATAGFALQEMTIQIRFRCSNATDSQGWLSLNGAGGVNGIAVNVTAGTAAMVLSVTNYKWWSDNISAYLDGKWHIMKVYVAGTGQYDIDNARMWIDNFELTAIQAINHSGLPDAVGNLNIGSSVYGFANADFDYVYIGKGKKVDFDDTTKHLFITHFQSQSINETLVRDITANHKHLTLSATNKQLVWTYNSIHITNPAEIFDEILALRGNSFLVDADSIIDSGVIFANRGYSQSSVIVIDDPITFRDHFQKFAISFGCNVFQDESGKVNLKILDWGLQTAADTFEPSDLGNTFRFSKNILYILKELQRKYLYNFRLSEFKKYPSDLIISTDWEAIKDNILQHYQSEDGPSLDVAGREIYLRRIPIIQYSFSLIRNRGKSVELAGVYGINSQFGYYPNATRLIQILYKNYRNDDLIDFEAVDITAINASAIILYNDADPLLLVLNNESTNPTACGVLV